MMMASISILLRPSSRASYQNDCKQGNSNDAKEGDAGQRTTGDLADL